MGSSLILADYLVLVRVLGASLGVGSAWAVIFARRFV